MKYRNEQQNIWAPAISSHKAGADVLRKLFRASASRGGGFNHGRYGCLTVHEWVCVAIFDSLSIFICMSFSWKHLKHAGCVGYLTQKARLISSSCYYYLVIKEEYSMPPATLLNSCTVVTINISYMVYIFIVIITNTTTTTNAVQQ